MKRFLLLTLAAGISLCLQAQKTGQIRFSDQSWEVPVKSARQDKSKATSHKTTKEARVGRPATVSATDYMAALQTFYDFDYNFSLTSGLANVYSIKIARNGNTVTISNMLNYDDENMSYYGYQSQDVSGVYDEATKTITIPTPHQDGNNVTIVGSDDYYSYALMAGHQDENNEFWPEDNLVFHVVGDFERIYTTQHIGVVSVIDGQTGYLEGSYASLLAQPKDNPNPLITIPTELDLGKTYPENELSGKLQLLNLGSDNLTYALSSSAGIEGVTLNPALGDIPSGGTSIVNILYEATNPVEFTLPIAVAYETSVAENTLNVSLKGEILPFPDYSPIVKEGLIDFATGYNYPFTIEENDGIKSAVSTAPQYYKTSWLEARVNVPDNHRGKLAYKGMAKCTDPNNVYAGHTVSIFVDGNDDPAYRTTADAILDGSFELEPGQHKVRFEFKMGMSLGDETDFGLRLSELALTTELAATTGVEILTPAIDFGGLLLDGASVSKIANIEIRNTGITPLKVTEFQSVDPAFTAEIPNEEASLMNTLTIPVTLTATEARNYESVLTVITSAGAIEVNASALVRALPDFSKILDDEHGVVKVTTDMDHPFVINADETKAHNANAGQADNTEETSTITFTITVPDNKIAYISWEANSSSDVSDQTRIYITGPSGFDYNYVRGITEANSTELYQGNERLLEMVPGTHTVEFAYTKNGDGTIAGDDIFAINKFSAKVEDFDTKASNLARTKVRFADCIIPEQGSNANKTFTTVYIDNLGSEELRVLYADEIKGDLPDARPFACIDPGYVVYHGQSLMVDLVFFPAEVGKFQNTITIPTTFGNHTVEAEGYAYTAEGMFLKEDLNDGASRWSLVDKDGDGQNWFKVTDMFYYRPNLQCFSGDNALMSYSANGNNEYTPDNYAVSPVFTVPSDGGMLSWWVAPVSEDAAEESYEVFIILDTEYDENKLGSYNAVFSETLAPEHMYFKQSTLDLAPYAGKQIRVAYRHNTAKTQSGIRLEDVYGFTNAKWNKITSSIKGIQTDSELVKVEYYDMAGYRVGEHAKGILLKRCYYNDGSIRVEKIVRN